MDHERVFRQAWHNVRHYHALWVFGLILALTTFSWGTVLLGAQDDDSGNPRAGLTINVKPNERFVDAVQRTLREEKHRWRAEINTINQDLDEFFAKELDLELKSDILSVVLVLAATFLAAYIIAKIAGYVSETALIRMVDETDETGIQHSVWRGIRLGWSRTAWRLFLINVLVNVSALLAIILVFALVAVPLALWITGSTLAGVIGTILTVGLFFPCVALVVIAGVTLAMLKQFFRRACAQEGLGVIPSIHRGYSVARQHLMDVLPVWIVAIVVTIMWPILMAPIAILLLGIGLLLGGAAALLAGGLASLALYGIAPWILAAAVGIPVFLLTLVAPLAFLGGLREIFLSSTWTLTYRELRVLESARPAHEPIPPGIESAVLV